MWKAKIEIHFWPRSQFWRRNHLWQQSQFWWRGGGGSGDLTFIYECNTGLIWISFTKENRKYSDSTLYGHLKSGMGRSILRTFNCNETNRLSQKFIMITFIWYYTWFYQHALKYKFTSSFFFKFNFLFNTRSYVRIYFVSSFSIFYLGIEASYQNYMKKSFDFFRTLDVTPSSL